MDEQSQTLLDASLGGLQYQAESPAQDSAEGFRLLAKVIESTMVFYTTAMAFTLTILGDLAKLPRRCI